MVINISYENFKLYDDTKITQKNDSIEKVITRLNKDKLKDENRENIYYIILDGMISLERFEAIYGTDKEILKSSLYLKKFNYTKCKKISKTII